MTTEAKMHGSLYEARWVFGAIFLVLSVPAVLGTGCILICG